MREPYGNLVEFISIYNYGGGFGGIDGRGFRIVNSNQGSTDKIMAWKIWWRLTKIGDYGEISKRAKVKSNQRPTG